MRSLFVFFLMLVAAFPALAQEEAPRAGIVGIQLAGVGDCRSIAGTAPNSPASTAGIKAGDYVLAVDGVSTKDFEFKELVEAISGTPGTQVILTLKREGSDQREHLVLTRVPREEIATAAGR